MNDVNWTTPRYVAVPGMTGLCKQMARGLSVDVQRSQRVAGLTRQHEGWLLEFEDGSTRSGYDWILSTAPAEQSALLLPDLTDWSAISMQGCFSLMIGFDSPVPLAFDAAVIRNNPIAWIAVNGSKPGRNDGLALVCQSDNTWADRHMDSEQGQVRDALCRALHEVTGIDPATATYNEIHRWRYAKVARPGKQPFLLDQARGLGAAGDWCGAGRVESAFDSAEALASDVLRAIRLEAA